MKHNKKLSSVGRDVLEMIKNKKIKPEPKWKFLLKDYFVWLVSVVSIMIGSISFSVILYMLKNSDWDVYENINDSLFEFILVSLPYFWILFLVLFVFIADYNLKHTKRGYKYQVHIITIVSVAVSMVSGLFLFNFGVGRAIDDVFAERIPIYKQTINKMHQRGRMWDRPNEGFLSGMVISMEDEKNFRISDTHNLVWNIYGEDAHIDEKTKLSINKGVRIFGSAIESDENVNAGEKSFHAEKILPLPSRSWLKREILRDGNLLDRLPPRREINRDEAMRKKDEQIKKDLEKIGKICATDSDCETPFSYMIRSNCPYESRCIENSCKVVCPKPFETKQDDLDKVPQCSKDSECDCDNFYKTKTDRCACINEMCMVIVAE